MDYTTKPYAWRERVRSMSKLAFVDRLVDKFNNSRTPAFVEEFTILLNTISTFIRVECGGIDQGWAFQLPMSIVSAIEYLINDPNVLRLSFKGMKLSKNITEDQLVKLAIKRYVHTLVSEALRKAKRLLRAILDIFFVLFGKELESKLWFPFLGKWFIAFLFDQGERVYKYQSQYFFCMMTDQAEFPPELDPPLPGTERKGFLLPSGGYKFLRKQLRLKNDDGFALAYSLTDAKRAGLPLSKTLTEKFIVKHKKNMLGEEYKGNEIKNKKEIEEHTMARIDDFINVLRPSFETVPRIPSQSATNISSRDNGGFMGTVLKDCDEANLFHCLYGIVYNSINKKLVPIYTYDRDEVESLIRQGALHELLENKRKLTANVHLVHEPFKVRPITCSTGYVYHMVRMYQKVVHTQLRKLLPFQLIGQEFDSGMASIYLNGCPMKFWNSGDFSAATDGISRTLQEYTTEKIVKNLSIFGDRFIAECVKASMDMHQLTYPDGQVIWQEWGQLMGSPFSFLILCIINFCTTWAACERAGWEDLSYNEFVRRHRPLINGDDNLFGFPDMSYYKTWVEYSQVSGLNRSPGKNYVSDKFLMVNSMPMKITRNTNNDIHFVTEYEVVNSGLIRGQGRVLSDTRSSMLNTRQIDEQVASACDQINWAVKNLSTLRRKRSFLRFQYNLRHKLKRSKRSWRLARELGGLNLPFGSTNYSQKKIAAYLLSTFDSEIESARIGKTVPSHIRYQNDVSTAIASFYGYYVPPVIISSDEVTRVVPERVGFPTLFLFNEEYSSMCTTGNFDTLVKRVRKISDEDLPPLTDSKINMSFKSFSAGIPKADEREHNFIHNAYSELSNSEVFYARYIKSGQVSFITEE